MIDRKIFQGLGKEGAHHRGDPAHPPRPILLKCAIAAERARDGVVTKRKIISPGPGSASATSGSYCAALPCRRSYLGTRDVFVNMGDFWRFPGQVQAIDRLKARHGFTVARPIYDPSPLGTTTASRGRSRRSFTS